MNNLLDISDKVDPDLVTLFEILSEVCGANGIPFFVVGATARDLIAKCYDMTPIRATRDVDIGIRVADWDQFNLLRSALLATGKFMETRALQRLSSRDGLPLDIVPFGELADRDWRIHWPGEEDRIMSVLGFEESFTAAITVRVRRDPPLELRVASLAGLLMTKIISWSERYPDRRRDAQDIHLIMVNYTDFGGAERILNEALDLLDVEAEIDIVRAGARLLGRDVARIASPRASDMIKAILQEETVDESEQRLITDMLSHRYLDRERSFDEAAKLLQEVYRGFQDKLPPL